MDNITIRKGKPEDAEDFSELALLSGPEFLPALFGPTVKSVWRNAFRHARSCFSYEHSHFIEANGETAGMALVYSYDEMRREQLRSGLFILRYLKWRFLAQLPYLRRAAEIMAQITEGDYYLSNIAVYPKFRSLGFGTKLLEAIEGEARAAGSKRMVLDVETDNTEATKLYERLGYTIEQKSPILRIRDKGFEFFRMSKDIAS